VPRRVSVKLRCMDKTPMEWRRFRRVGTAGLGLFALLLQLTLSFGHIHPESLRPSLAGVSHSQASGTLDGNVVAVPDATVPDDQKQIPNGHPEDDCPICLTMHMVAAGAQPMPPMVFVPLDFGFVLHPTIVEKFLYHVPRHALFQTRAPPIA
jgi:hypothetical protein